jgi:hypothetical protein
MGCAATHFGLCLTRPPADAGVAIFGFAEFIAALALLVLVFNSTDFLYRFRIAVAPFPLILFTFLATAFIGFGSLLTDLWFAERWPALAWAVSRADIQAALGAFFLLVALLWMWFAFISPPVFGRWNCKHFHHSVFQAIVRGSDTQLPVIGSELARSATPLLRHAAPGLARRGANEDTPRFSKVERYAHDTLLMLGNRKLCRHIVATSPVTAIVVMQEASRLKRYDAPLGEFARNITTEAILNKDSILYLEDDLYANDLVGQIQPFSKAMYGDYRLIEALGSARFSPLDIDWRVAWSFNAAQFDAYCRLVLVTFRSFVAGDHYRGDSQTFYRAFEIIQEGTRDIGRLNGVAPDGEINDALARLSAAVRFVVAAIDILEKRPNLDTGVLRARKGSAGYRDESIFDRLAGLLYELVNHAAWVQTPSDRAWTVQHNAVWSMLRRHGRVWKIVRFKLFRLLFDEIKEMETWPNFQGASLLGFCLNVCGLTEERAGDFGREEKTLRKAIIRWTRRNYLAIVEKAPHVAEHCLSGGISFDAENSRLVKTYIRGTRIEAPKEYLPLLKPRPARRRSRAGGAGKVS